MERAFQLAALAETAGSAKVKRPSFVILRLLHRSKPTGDNRRANPRIGPIPTGRRSTVWGQPPAGISPKPNAFRCYASGLASLLPGIGHGTIVGVCDVSLTRHPTCLVGF
jgi:hypothetical protein